MIMRQDVFKKSPQYEFIEILVVLCSMIYRVDHSKRGALNIFKAKRNNNEFVEKGQGSRFTMRPPTSIFF